MIPNDPILKPGDHYRCLGETEWRTVAASDYRTAAAMSTADLFAAIGLELRRRADDFAAVLSADDGSGTYRTTSGKTKKFTYTVTDGIVAILTPAFAPATPAVVAASAPDPYKAGLAALRAANATPEQIFEDSYKAARLAELLANRAARDAEAAATIRLTAAEEDANRAKYAPPDSYAAGLKALKEQK